MDYPFFYIWRTDAHPFCAIGVNAPQYKRFEKFFEHAKEKLGPKLKLCAVQHGRPLEFDQDNEPSDSLDERVYFVTKKSVDHLLKDFESLVPEELKKR